MRRIPRRYAVRGILDERGVPKQQMGILEISEKKGQSPIMQGGRCPECGNYTMIRKDGCDYCTACGYVGVCG